MKYLIAIFMVFSVHAMAGAMNGGNATATRKGSISGGYGRTFWFQASTPVPVTRVTGSVSSPATFKDRNYLSATTTSVTDFYFPFIYENDRPKIETVARSSSATGVIIPSSTDLGMWTYVSSGSSTLTISSSSRTVSYVVTTSNTTGAVTQFSGFNTSSAAYSAQQAIDSRISGKTLAANGNIFSTRDDTNAVYVRGTNCWAYGLDLTGISVWNSYGGSQWAGTLISRRHVLFANHAPHLPNGTFMRFVSGSNATVTGTLSATVYAASDILVGILSGDIPNSISCYSLMPQLPVAQVPIPTLDSTVLNDGHAWRVPVIGTDQSKRAVVWDTYGSITNPSLSTLWCCWSPTDTNRLALNSNPLISGDSGSPVFMIVNGTPVLVTHWWWANGEGPDYSQFIPQINAAMHSLSVLVGAGTDYQVSTVNLSGFASY